MGIENKEILTNCVYDYLSFLPFLSNYTLWHLLDHLIVSVDKLKGIKIYHYLSGSPFCYALRI